MVQTRGVLVREFGELRQLQDDVSRAASAVVHHGRSVHQRRRAVPEAHDMLRTGNGAARSRRMRWLSIRGRELAEPAL